ncbi:hypothetical protein ABK040_006783 [Willaertia magna]
MGRIEAIKSFVSSNKGEINTTDRYGNSLLYYACLAGHSHLVRYLCEMGAVDDRYGRCYWNSLSLDIRRILKLYNNYQKIFNTQTSSSTKKKQNETMKDKEEEEIEEMLEVVTKESISGLLMTYVKKCLFYKKSNKDNEPEDLGDIDLKIKFIDCEKPVIYHCHRFILLPRWKHLIEIACKIIPELKENYNTSLLTNENNTKEIVTTEKKEEEENYDNIYTFTIPEIIIPTNSQYEAAKWTDDEIEDRAQKLVRGKPKSVRNKVKSLKKTRTDAKKIITEFTLKYDTHEEELLPLDENEMKEFCNNYLSTIDFGKVPFKKEIFDVILIYLYTGMLIDPIKMGKTFLPKQKRADKLKEWTKYFQSLFEVASAFRLYEIKDLIISLDLLNENCTLQNDVINNIQLKMKKKLLDDISPESYFLESQPVFNGFDILRKQLCTMRVCLAEAHEGDEYDTILSQHDISKDNIVKDAILCHKHFMMDRSIFFEVIVNCQFEEGQKFREEESLNLIPTIEFQQCTQFDIIKQLILYAYTERINITEENAVELAIHAERLGFHELSKRAEEFVIETITDDNCLEMYRLAYYLSSDNMKRGCEARAIRYFSKQCKQASLPLEKIEEILFEIDVEEEAIVRIKEAVKNYLDKYY